MTRMRSLGDTCRSASALKASYPLNHSYSVSVLKRPSQYAAVAYSLLEEGNVASVGKSVAVTFATASPCMARVRAAVCGGRRERGTRLRTQSSVANNALTRERERTTNLKHREVMLALQTVSAAPWPVARSCGQCARQRQREKVVRVTVIPGFGTYRVRMKRKLHKSVTAHKALWSIHCRSNRVTRGESRVVGMRGWRRGARRQLAGRDLRR